MRPKAAFAKTRHTVNFQSAMIAFNASFVASRRFFAVTLSRLGRPTYFASP